MLVRLASYLDRLFQLRDRVDSLRDSRPRPQIPTANVWLSVLLMFVLRQPSLNAAEQQLRRPRRWERWVGKRKPSADTIGRTMSCFSVSELRDLLGNVCRISWKRKAIHQRPGETWRAVALDGHELGSSRSRCCSGCLKRTITTTKGLHIEYYHRVVAAQWIGVTPAAILDFESIQPGEGEVVAARRLLTRILEQYPRLIDVIVADALYLEAGFFKHVLEAGKHAVVVMKQEARELYQDANLLRTVIEPEVISDANRDVRLWDLPHLESFTTLGSPVRVIWTEEQWVARRRVGGTLLESIEQSEWAWVTDLSPSQASAMRVRRWGRDRWDIENQGFNELSNLWHMNHYYVHDPVAIDTLLLTLALAFLFTYLFFERNLKPQVKRHQSRLSLVILFMQDLTLESTVSLWPAPFP